MILSQQSMQSDQTARDWWLFAMLLFFMLVGFVCFSPDIPSPPKKLAAPIQPSQPEIPSYVGKWNWGEMAQEGRSIKMSGSSSWEFVGEIRKDGKLQVLWTRLSDGAPCPGVYAPQKDGNLVGHWGEHNTVQIGDDGSLAGAVRGETLYRVK